MVEFTSGCAEVASSLVYLKAGPVNNVTGTLLPGSEMTILKQVSVPPSSFSALTVTGRQVKYFAHLENNADGFLEIQRVRRRSTLRSFYTHVTGMDQGGQRFQSRL